MPRQHVERKSRRSNVGLPSRAVKALPFPATRPAGHPSVGPFPGSMPGLSESELRVPSSVASSCELRSQSSSPVPAEPGLNESKSENLARESSSSLSPMVSTAATNARRRLLVSLSTLPAYAWMVAALLLLFVLQSLPLWLNSLLPLILMLRAFQSPATRRSLFGTPAMESFPATQISAELLAAHGQNLMAKRAVSRTSIVHHTAWWIGSVFKRLGSCFEEGGVHILCLDLVIVIIAVAYMDINESRLRTLRVGICGEWIDPWPSCIRSLDDLQTGSPPSSPVRAQPRTRPSPARSSHDGAAAPSEEALTPGDHADAIYLVLEEHGPQAIVPSVYATKETALAHTASLWCAWSLYVCKAADSQFPLLQPRPAGGNRFRSRVLERGGTGGSLTGANDRMDAFVAEDEAVGAMVDNFTALPQ